MVSQEHAAVTPLTAAFRDIAEKRMQGIPLVNDSLEVEAVGFTEWDGRLLGVLIAPWHMNLVLLPGENDDWNHLESGEKQAWKLPSGEYEFTVSRLEAVPVYQSCALFSSVEAFPDQQTARLVAQTIMAEILESPGKHGTGHATLPSEAPGEKLSRRELFKRTFGR